MSVCALTLLQGFPVLVPFFRQLMLLSNNLFQLLLYLEMKISNIRITTLQKSNFIVNK